MSPTYDHTTLRRLLGGSPTLEGLAIGGVAPKLDGERVAYVGLSLGGMIGALTAGIEPDHAAYVLDVPGAGMFREVVPGAPNLLAEGRRCSSASIARRCRRGTR